MSIINKTFVLFAMIAAIMMLLSACARTPTGAEALCDEEGCPEPVEEGILPTESGDDTKEVVAQEIGGDAQADGSEDISEVTSGNADILPTKTVVEGDLVSFPNLRATDPDGDPVTYTFSEPLSREGAWQTKVGDAGTYKVTITASDGKNKVSQDVMIIVKPANNAPELSAPEQVAVDEGDTVELKVSATDEDNDKVSIEFSGWMTSSTKETGYNDAGTHAVTVTASDGKESVSKRVNVVVTNVNRAPKLEAISDIEVDEGETITLSANAVDPDGDKVTYSYSDYFDSDGVWETEKGDAGVYYVTVTASDGSVTDSKKVTLKVNSLNKAPVISGLKDITVNEGETVRAYITASDPEGSDVEITFSGWMTSDLKVTDYEDAGEYVVTVTASDGVNEARNNFKVTVNNVNRAPVFGEDSFE
jgi:hypothetical protein